MMNLTELARSVFDKTREGKLIWSELGQNIFVTNIGENTVTIRGRSNLFELIFRDSQGKILDKIDADTPEYSEINTIVEKLYELARRQALKVDETLMEIKRNLDTL